MSAANESRLGVGVIGAGKVGPVLARALAGAGHAITGISAISDESRERAEVMLPGVPVLDVAEVVRRSELVLIAIPGDELPGLIAGLTATGAWQPGQLVIHTAPEYGFGVFAPAMAAGVIPLALHPALQFTGTSLDLTRLAGASIAVTAPAPVLPIGMALAVEMGAEPITIAEADRAAYADAITASRDLVGAVVRQGLEGLAAIGIDRPQLLLGGMVRAALEEALSSGVVAGNELDAEFDAGSGA